MKVHPLIAGAVIVAFFSLQGWTLQKVNALGEKVAALSQRVDDALGHTAARQSFPTAEPMPAILITPNLSQNSNAKYP